MLVRSAPHWSLPRGLTVRPQARWARKEGGRRRRYRGQSRAGQGQACMAGHSYHKQVSIAPCLADERKRPAAKYPRHVHVRTWVYQRAWHARLMACAGFHWLASDRSPHIHLQGLSPTSWPHPCTSTAPWSTCSVASPNSNTLCRQHIRSHKHTTICSTIARLPWWAAVASANSMHSSSRGGAAHAQVLLYAPAGSACAIRCIHCGISCII